MILHLAPDAPPIARFAADAALVGHIGGGVLGVGAGFVALAARKGYPVHRAAGTAFLGAMVVAYAVGAAVAPLIRQPANTFGALFALYLLATAWGAARHSDGRPGRIERGAVVAAAAAAVALAAYAVAGAVEPRLLLGMAWPVPLFDAGLAALVAALDQRVIRRGLLADDQRIRRHLWRMCLAMFIGTGSLFLGQPKVFPEGLRGSPVLWVLALAPLAAMAFWLVRVRRPGRPDAAGPVSPVSTPA